MGILKVGQKLCSSPDNKEMLSGICGDYASLIRFHPSLDFCGNLLSVFLYLTAHNTHKDLLFTAQIHPHSQCRMFAIMLFLQRKSNKERQKESFAPNTVLTLTHSSLPLSVHQGSASHYPFLLQFHTSTDHSPHSP